MSWFKENFIYDQTTYESIIWCEMQMTLKTEQAQISIAKPFFSCQKSHACVQVSRACWMCFVPSPSRLQGPYYQTIACFTVCRPDTSSVRFCSSVTDMISQACQILHPHVEPLYEKHSTWQVIKMLNPGESCIYDGWMYVCFIYLIEGPCVRLDDINQSYCQWGNISVFLWMFWKKNKNQWQCLELWKMKYLSITIQKPSIQE